MCGTMYIMRIQENRGDILLQTVSGSHLYGLATPESDYDTFVVYADKPNGSKRARYSKQTITEQEDVVTPDLSTFMLYAQKGVPQYVEAMWSNQADIDVIHDLRHAFKPDYYNTVTTYQRTIKSFYAHQTKKRIRHAYRLLLNLQDFMAYGKFDPTLDEEHLERLTRLLEQDIIYDFRP